jgi:hypothetical protein
MRATTTEHKRHHWGWQRHRTRSKDVPGRTAPAHEAAAEVEAEARWLDDGGLPRGRGTACRSVTTADQDSAPGVAV